MMPDFMTLYDLYVTQRLSSVAIAKMYGTDKGTIRSWLIKYQIPRRSVSGARNDHRPNEGELKELYINQQLATNQIAERCGVSDSAVNRWLSESNIPRRNIRDLESRGMTKPTHDILLDLYVTQHMTTRQIGAHLGFAPTSIKNWLREYNIERRPKSDGLVSRGITPPTKEELIDLVHVQHLTYKEIAQMYKADASAVTHWLRKHEIPQPTIWDTRRKGIHPILPTEQELRDLYEKGISLTDIGKMFGVSASTIRPLCDKFSIAVKPDGFDGGKRYECEDGHLVRSVYEQRVDNWLHQHGIKHNIEPRLPFNKHFKADFYANGWYIEVWGVIQNKEYTERRKRKVKGYQSHNMPLIEIEVHNFVKCQTMSDQWERKLQKVLELPFISATLLDFA